MAVTLELGDHRSLMRLVSGDEKFNLSASGSCENSQLLFTEASLFEKKRNPFSQFTLSKIKELLSNNHRQQLLQLKDQLLSYYNRINLVYKTKKERRNTSHNESSEASLNTSVLSKWDDVWVGKPN